MFDISRQVQTTQDVLSGTGIHEQFWEDKTSADMYTGMFCLVQSAENSPCTPTFRAFIDVALMSIKKGEHTTYTSKVPFIPI